MGLFNKQRTDGYSYDGQGENRQGLVDVIKYNGEADEIVWKFPYENLTTGAQLVVNQSQEAVFLKGGAVCDIFSAGTHTLSTGNIPILQKLVNLPFGDRSPFTAEVWYVNTTVRRNLGFGTPVPIDLLDPLYGVSIPVRSFGKYGIRITDSGSFVKQMVGTLHLTTNEDIIEQFRAYVIRKLSSCISQYIVQKNITIVQISAFIDELSGIVKEAIKDEFAQYGLEIVNFDIESINFDKDDPNVRRIMEAQTAASSMDFESAALARKRAREGYSYQQERQFDVMQSAAGNEGSAGQLMGAGMGIGMGFGVGGAFSNAMQNMSGVMQGQQAAPGAAGGAPTPPPPPVAPAYHVLINNAQQGPYDMATLQQLVQNGQLTPETYVWKAGMPAWGKAGEQAELASLFAAVPPPPPVM